MQAEIYFTSVIPFSKFRSSQAVSGIIFSSPLGTTIMVQLRTDGTLNPGGGKGRTDHGAFKQQPYNHAYIY